MCLVVGNEVEGIAESLQMLSDAAIEIEMDGIKRYFQEQRLQESAATIRSANSDTYSLRII